MASLLLAYSDYYTRVSNFLALTTTGTAPTGTDLTTCEDIVARGLRQFLYPIDARNGMVHRWNFLEKFGHFTSTASQWKCALSNDFSEMISPIHFESDELEPPLIQKDKSQILEYRADCEITGGPQFYAIVPAVYDLELGTTYELWLYPTPDQAYTFNYFYRFDPLKPSTASDIMVGGIRACEALLESCLAVAETQEEDNTSVHHQNEARRLVQALIIADTFTKTDTIGNLYHDRDYEWPPQRPLFVPFKDSNIYS